MATTVEYFFAEATAGLAGGSLKVKEVVSTDHAKNGARTQMGNNNQENALLGKAKREHPIRAHLKEKKIANPTSIIKRDARR